MQARMNSIRASGSRNGKNADVQCSETISTLLSKRKCPVALFLPIFEHKIMSNNTSTRLWHLFGRRRVPIGIYAFRQAEHEYR